MLTPGYYHFQIHSFSLSLNTTEQALVEVSVRTCIQVSCSTGQLIDNYPQDESN